MRTLIATAVACAGLALVPAPQADADVYDEFFAAVDWLAHKYGVDAYVGQQPLNPDTYAITGGNTIYLNSSYVMQPEMFYAHVAEDSASGHHRATNCTAPQAVAAHEYAHVLDNVTGRTARTELLAALRSGFSGEISGYGLESPAEAIAESFAAVECDNPTPAERAIYTMLVN